MDKNDSDDRNKKNEEGSSGSHQKAISEMVGKEMATDFRDGADRQRPWEWR